MNKELYILEFAKALMGKPNLEFNPKDLIKYKMQGKYADELIYKPTMKYELTILEATKYAEAFLTLKEQGYFDDSSPAKA